MSVDSRFRPTALHIIHLGKYYHPAVGGMESLIRSQAQSQASLGHTVEVVAVNHISASGSNVLGKPLGITATATESDGSVTIHRVGRIANFAKCDFTPSLRKTLTEIAARQPDIWHLHTPNATMVLWLQSLLNVCSPIVVTHHSDITNQRYLRPAYQFVERRVYDRAATILSDSPNYIRGSQQLQPYLDRVEVLPIGIDVASFRTPCVQTLEWERHYRSEFGESLWLCVGRLAHYKGLEVAIRALECVPGTLVIIGTGPREDGWKQLANELKVADRIRWLGRCTDVQLRGAYRAATALWFPSNARNEGFGIVQVEAMACGCPVINTDLPHSGVSWVSQHEHTGLTVPVNNPEALANAAQRILSEPGLRARLSESARARATDCFDQNLLNHMCLDIYRKAIIRHAQAS